MGQGQRSRGSRSKVMILAGGLTPTSSCIFFPTGAFLSASVDPPFKESTDSDLTEGITRGFAIQSE